MNFFFQSSWKFERHPRFSLQLVTCEGRQVNFELKLGFSYYHENQKNEIHLIFIILWEIYWRTSKTQHLENSFNFRLEKEGRTIVLIVC